MIKASKGWFSMLFRHTDKELQKVDENAGYKAGLAENLVRAFRMRMQAIRAAAHENDLRSLKSLHFEKLKGTRANQYSIRLNARFRLVFEIEKGNQGNTLVILGIEDYH
jgi:proteic killer suppression protein